MKPSNSFLHAITKHILLKLLILFLLPIGYMVAQDSTNTEVPATVLFKQRNQHSFSISPDGKFFAEVIVNNFENDIIIVDIDGYVLFNKIPLGRKSVDNLYWLNSKRLLYESSGAIYAIDIDGTNGKLIVDHVAYMKNLNWRNLHQSFRVNTLLSILPEKEHVVLIETYDYELNASIKEINIYTGKQYTVVNGELHKMNKWILDSEKNIRLGVRYTDDGLTYLIKNASTEKWEQFFVNIDGKPYPLIVSANTFLNQNLTFEGFGYDTNIIYLTTNINSDKRKLIAYNITEGKVAETLIDDVNCDIQEPHGDRFSFIFDYVEGSVAGLRYESLVPQYRWFSQNYATLHNTLNAKYPRFINDIIDVDGSGNRFVIHQWSDINAGNIGIYDSSDNSYAVMFHFNEELNKFNLSRTKIVTANARDEHKLPGYLTLPVNYDETSQIPLVVIPHGGPWVRDYWGLDEYSQYFSSRGYASLRVNFRGSTGFGKEHVLAGVNSIDEIMINDIADAVLYIADQYNIDRNRIFIYGHSYGGYATYMSLLKYPELYAGGVAVSAPTDIKEWVKQQKKEENLFSYEFWKTALGNRKPKYLDDISPISFVKDIQKPVLIFHGEYDRIIPLEHATNMAKGLEKNKKKVTLEIIQREGHSISDTYSMGYILDKAFEFFQQGPTN